MRILIRKDDLEIVAILCAILGCPPPLSPLDWTGLPVQLWDAWGTTLYSKLLRTKLRRLRGGLPEPKNAPDCSQSPGGREYDGFSSPPLGPPSLKKWLLSASRF